MKRNGFKFEETLPAGEQSQRALAAWFRGLAARGYGTFTDGK